jgi:uncharacterized membrane protein YedE/YeeE
MSNFTPLPALAGGALIGLAASLLLLTHGKVAGISGIYGGLFDRDIEDKPLRFYFLAGLVVAGVIARFVVPSAVSAGDRSLLFAAAGGLLVGAGTQLGNGCTSGHGVCGISRLSRRSIVATITFLGTGVLTVLALRLIGGAS